MASEAMLSDTPNATATMLPTRRRAKQIRTGDDAFIGFLQIGLRDVPAAKAGGPLLETPDNLR
jgi:hypothetical protein